MTKKSLQTILAVLLIATFILTACAQQQPATQPAAPAATEAPMAEEVVIRWRTRPDNQQEQDVYQKIS